MSVLSRVRGSVTFLKLFPLRDIPHFRRLEHVTAGDAEELHVRALGRAAGIYCRPGTSDRNVLWDAFAHQYHSPLQRVREDGVIFDVGANVGYTTAHFAKQFPRARVIGIEMDADNAALARRNTRCFGERVQIIQAAVWTSDGEIAYGGETAFGFRVSNVPRSASQRNDKHAAALTLNTLCQQVGVTTIDFMKMDIEGAEAHVLYENNDWLQRVQAMNLEVHAPANRRDCMTQLQRFGLGATRHPTHPWGVVASRAAVAAVASAA